MQINSLLIYNDLRKKLVVSGFKQGQKLKLESLRQEYGCAISTLREVLFRLSCEGFVEFVEQKGFRTPVVSDENLREIMNFRIMLERECARLSIENSNIEWESRLAAAHYRLAHIEKRMQNAESLSEFAEIWSDAEWGFHRALVSRCGSELLLETHHNIFDRHRQHMLMRSKTYGFRNETTLEHEKILASAINGDADECCRQIELHLKNSFTASKQMAA